VSLAAAAGDAAVLLAAGLLMPALLVFLNWLDDLF